MDDDKIISGKKIKLTNLEKIFFPEEKITKGDLLKYYSGISKYILPYLKDRPESLNRFPNGINGKSFYQKNVGKMPPQWVKTADVYSESNKAEIKYIVCTDKASLLYIVNLGCIEINPWSSRIEKLDYPDYLVIDLDPEEIGFDKVIETARTVKEVADKADASAYCKTSGATGIHIYIPLKAKYEYAIAREFAHVIAVMTNSYLPGITSLERSPSKRKGKVYLDYLQNSRGQTLAAPYSVRPKPRATVSAPLEWKELKTGLEPGDFTIKNILKRIEKKGDLFSGVLKSGVNIKRSLKNLGA